MYEMYPQQWGARAEQPATTSSDAEKPRRRARRAHQIAPRVIRVSTSR